MLEIGLSVWRTIVLRFGGDIPTWAYFIWIRI